MGLDSNKKLKSYIEREQLYCVLNNTKWDKLFSCLEPHKNYLDFQRKDLDESSPIENKWNDDIYEIFGLSQKIEWLNIHIFKSHESDVLDLIKKAHIPLSKQGENYRVWGYIRQGVSPEWLYT
tara:strand:- start:2739 stop:3107 length:369 start_codon:yes stop_codon:yes gene_type:complete